MKKATKKAAKTNKKFIRDCLQINCLDLQANLYESQATISDKYRDISQKFCDESRLKESKSEVNSKSANLSLKTSSGQKPLALITGGATRIGKSFAYKLAENGYDLQIWCNSSEKSANLIKKDLWQKFQSKVEVVKCDLFDPSQTEAAANQFIKNCCNLSLLINNASIFKKSSFLANNSEEFQKNLQIHLLAPMQLSQAFASNFLAQNLSGGQIINIVDKSITRTETSYFHYLLTKKFLAETTKLLALQLAPKIRVNAIAPSAISIPNDQTQANYLIKAAKLNPIGRVGELSEVVLTLEFLINNHFINGQIIFVDGASSLNHGE